MNTTEKQTYVSPVVLSYGSLIQGAKGGDGNDSESCSSGKYENTSDDEE